MFGEYSLDILTFFFEALQLDGMLVLGVPVSIKRPNDAVSPLGRPWLGRGRGKSHLGGSSQLLSTKTFPIYVRHEVKGHLEGVRSNPILRGRNRSPWLLTTY